jgi:hypothetical protein
MFEPRVHHAAGSAPMHCNLPIGFTQHWCWRVTIRGSSQDTAKTTTKTTTKTTAGLSQGRHPMSISSISSISVATPVTAPNPVSANTPNAQSSDAPNDNDADDAGAAQPTVQAPLPPGQGTRIDQLV